MTLNIKIVIKYYDLKNWYRFTYEMLTKIKIVINYILLVPDKLFQVKTEILDVIPTFVSKNTTLLHRVYNM